MHDMIMTRFTEWAEAQLPMSTTRDEALSRARATGIDPEAITVLEHLPERAYGREELISTVRENLMLKLGHASSTMRGFGGSA